MQPVVFLDRDGVLIENRAESIRSAEEIVFLPGALEALERLARNGWAVVIVSNQAVVGRGLLSLESAWAIQREVVEVVRQHGGRIDASYLCPHSPEAHCACRKPAPGMLLQAAQSLDIDLAHSYLIGDALTDLRAARAVHVPGILVLTGRGKAEVRQLERADTCLVAVDLGAAVDYILAQVQRDALPVEIPSMVGQQ